MPEIPFDDFAKLDIRIGTVVAAAAIILQRFLDMRKS